MAERGAIVDPQYQRDPSAEPGTPVTGTVNPANKRVRNADVQNIVNGIHSDSNGKLIIGTFNKHINNAAGVVIH